MRAMRYEVFAWADSACQAPGALDHPLAPMLTGMRAYGAWVRGEFDLAVRLAEETRHLEHQLSVFPSGLAERTLANVLYIVGDSTTGHAEGLRQIELAEESGNRSRLVHACYMGAVGHSSHGDYDEANGLVRRAHELAERTASPTDYASAEVARGFASRTENEALEAFTVGGRDARAVGNRWMHSVRVHRGERATRVPRGAGGRVRGSGRHGRGLVPRRRLVTAVAHVVALCDRSGPNRSG